MSGQARGESEEKDAAAARTPPQRTGGDDDELAAAQRVEQLRLAGVALDLGGARDVREVGRDARRVGDIKEAELADERVLLEQQRERLADAAGGAEHRDLGLFVRGDRSSARSIERERGGRRLCRRGMRSLSGVRALSLAPSLALRLCHQRTLEADDPGMNCAARRLTRSIATRGPLARGGEGGCRGRGSAGARKNLARWGRVMLANNEGFTTCFNETMRCGGELRGVT